MSRPASGCAPLPQPPDRAFHPLPGHGVLRLHRHSRGAGVRGSPQYNILHMMQHSSSGSHHAHLAALSSLALWIFASYWSLRDLRFTQTFIWGLISRFVTSCWTACLRQVQKKTFTDADISRFHWVNTRPPTEREHRVEPPGEFVDYRLSWRSGPAEVMTSTT